MIELSSALGTPRLKRKLGIRSHTAVRQKKKKKKKETKSEKTKTRKNKKQKKQKKQKKNFTNRNSAWIFQNVEVVSFKKHEA